MLGAVAGFTEIEIPFLNSFSSELIIKYLFLAVAVIRSANFSHSLVKWHYSTRNNADSVSEIFPQVHL